MMKTICVLVLLSLSGAPGIWACCGAGIGPVAEAEDPEDCQDEDCVDCPPKTNSPSFMKSGNYRFTQTDLVLEGRGPVIAVSRVYNSRERYTGPLGKGWHHSLVIQLFKTVDATAEHLLLRQPNAGRVRYTKSGSTYTPPVGHREEVTEEPDGRITVRRPNGDVWTFDADGWISTIVDRNGNALTWTYSTVGSLKRPASVEGPDGRRATIAWLDAGRIESIADHTGRTVVYEYDQDKNLRSVKNPANQYWTYQYRDGDDRLLLERVEFQNVIYATASYDTSDRVIAYMENGQSETIEYLDGKTVKRDAAGKQWEYLYKGDGVITKIVNPDGFERIYSYNPDNTLSSLTEEDGAGWEYVYGGLMRPTAITRRVGANNWTWTIEYDAQSAYQPSRIMGPSGWGGMKLGYDEAGNLIEVKRLQRDDTTEELLYTIERNSFGEATAVVDASGARTEYEYSTSGRLETIRLPANNGSGISPVYTLGYDSAGRLTSVTDALNRVTAAVYDSLDRLTQATLPNPGTGATGFVRQQSYDSMPYDGKFRVVSTDFNGATTTSYLDVWGHLTKLVDAAGNEVKLAWSNGLPVEIEDAEHNRTTYTYDDLQRLDQILHPEGATTQFTYAPTSRVLTRRDRKNQTTTFGYDELGRLVSRQYPEGAISYEYSGPVVSTVRDNAQGGGEKLTSYVYDQSLRLTSVTNDRGVVEYQWLPGDMLGGYRLDAGAWINYTYYPSGDMHTIQREGDASPFEYTYLIDGARQMLRYSNGSTVNYTWDDLGRVLALTNLDPTGGLISRYSYLYDLDHASGQFTKKGLRVAMTEALPSGSTGQEQYFFDNLYQLTRTIYPNGEDHAWTYDRIGNRMSSSVTIPPDPPVVTNYSYYPNGRGGNSQLLQSDGVNTYTWDANGNMATKTAADGIHYYSWNSRNLLTGITAPGLSAMYSYDLASRQTSKESNSVETAYQFVGWQVARATEPTMTSEHIFGADVDEILQTKIDTTEYCYLADALGSVRQLTDSTGTHQNSYSYSSWGQSTELSAAIPNAFTYTGRETIEDGLLGFRFRLYDPSLGRFVSEDPIRLMAGDMNFFRYVRSDPINLVDPWGLFDLEADLLAGLPDIPDWVGNVSAGIGDALLMGYGDELRDWTDDKLGWQGGAAVDRCSKEYEYSSVAGSAAMFALGEGRLLYAGLSKGMSLLLRGEATMASAARAVQTRNALKSVARLGLGKSRMYTLEDRLARNHGDIGRVIERAGKTDNIWNLGGVLGVAGGIKGVLNIPECDCE